VYARPVDTEALRQAAPFAETLGAEVLAASPEEVRLRLDWTPGRTTAGGSMHGGALMSLADMAGAICAYLHLPDGATGTTTIESKTNFLRALRDGHVEAIARPLHAGRTTTVVDTELRDADGRLVARTTQTQAVLTS
jgi:1,4-dihydroxy-2-naphthoyl-CoA hydrolase